MSVVLLDIEGTTTPIDFVTRILFPYARAHMAEFLAHPDDQLAADLEMLHAERVNDSEAPAEDLDYLYWLMDRDRKSPALKSIQGRIWAKGYQAGELQGEVYADVLPAIQRWRGEGKRIYIYSSGSVLAQKLIFGHLPEGDVTPLLDGHFDTAVGAKVEAESYRRIAENLEIAPAEALFLSDAPKEIAAAQEAGMQAQLISRDGGDGRRDFDGL